MFLNPFPIIYNFKYDFKFDQFKDKVDAHLQKSKERIDEFDIHTPERDDAISSVVMDDYPHNWPEFEDFRNELSQHIPEVLNEWQIKKGTAKHISNSWINVHNMGGWTADHVHHASIIAISCYLNVPPASGRFMIKNPMHMYKLGEPVDDNYHLEYESSGAQGDWTFIEVETNDVLLFPGWLTHRTERCNSSLGRYIMSMNLTLAR